MNYLLDADIIIDFTKKKENAIHLFEQIKKQNKAISIIAWLEVVYGIVKSPQAEKRKQQFDTWINTSHIETIHLNEEIADIFVRLKIDLEKKGDVIADFDLLIASTAIAHKLTLVTRNIKHFSRIKNLKILT